MYKIANVLDALPKRLQPDAKKLLHELMEAPTRADAAAARERFREQFDAKYPQGGREARQGLGASDRVL